MLICVFLTKNVFDGWHLTRGRKKTKGTFRWKKKYFEGKRSKCCTIVSEQQQYPLTFLELFFDQVLSMKVTLNLSVPASAQWKEKLQLNLDLLAPNLLWLIGFCLHLWFSLSSKSLWYWQLLQFTRSISSVRIDFYHTTYTIQQLSDISDLWNDRLAKQLQKIVIDPSLIRW